MNLACKNPYTEVSTSLATLRMPEKEADTSSAGALLSFGCSCLEKQEKIC